MKSRDLETLTANMRKKLSWADFEEAIKKDPKTKLPDRRALTLWNGFELSRFRAVEEDWEAQEDQIRNVEERQAEVRQAARAGGNVVELGDVAEALNNHARRIDMMTEHHRQMNETDRQQREAMNIEHRRAMEELTRAQREAQQREHMAAEVQRVHVDREAAVRDRLVAAREAAGLPHQNVTNVYNTHHHNNSTHNTDNSTHNTTSNTLHDQTVHNQMMQMVHNHSAQLGNMMHTMHLDQTQMHELLRAHLHVRSPQEPAPLENVISGGHPPPGPPPGGVGVSMSASHAAPHQPIHLHFATPNVTNVMGGWQPPPPPPSSGMAAIAAAAAQSKPPSIRDLMAHGAPPPSQPPSGGAPPLAISLLPAVAQPSALEVLANAGGGQPPPGPPPGAATAIAAVAEAPRRIQKNDGPYRRPSKPRAKSVPKAKSPAPAPAPAP